MALDADVIVIGAGLAGLAATAELADAGRRVILLDQEPAASLGGQAHWSLGGLFLVGSPEQRRMRIRDSRALARRDWLAAAGFDRPGDDWPRRWAEAYVDFAAGEQRAWLRAMGVRFFPVVGRAGRGGPLADGPGNSVPRFHVVWGAGPGLLEPFVRRVRAAAAHGLVDLRFRHRVTGLAASAGAVDTVTGEVLVPSAAARGEASSREAAGRFELRARAVVLASGGIGGNHELVRAAWPARLGTPPGRMLSGVPAHVDGLMLGVAADAGAALVNGDRTGHRAEGIADWDPVWARHGIRVLPGPSALRLDALGRRLPASPFPGPDTPGFGTPGSDIPGSDTPGPLEQLGATGYDHSWLVLNRGIVEREFALAGSAQNPELTGRSLRGVLRRALPGVPGPVRTHLAHGPDFVVAGTLHDLARGMNAKARARLIDTADLRRVVEDRDRRIAGPFGADPRAAAVHGARRRLGDRLLRAAAPRRILDPAAAPLIAVRLSVLTGASLGGLHTDLSARVLRPDGSVLDGLYAAGEAAGFGGGGLHGHRSLEGTFLGGCLFSGRTAGRAAAAATA
ncbi:FAD-binding dehydrogenase [Kitasatospora sp. NPDC056184]|uniref:FAD-binding dehydrogenase n=1 Tax=Kitasatospora sp. NPDC056184 TaxID=3345738 RepID=UPI0035DFA2B5